MKKALSMLAACVLAAVSMTGCVSTGTHTTTMKHLENEQAANQALAAELERNNAENEALRNDNQKLRNALKEVKAIEAPKVDEEALYKKLREEWEREAKGDWEMVRKGGSVGVRIDDRGVLFKSGSWELTDKTKQTLGRLVAEMNKHMDAMTFIRVDGHTDGDPVKKAKSAGIQDNIHLSMMRSMAVRSYLVSKGVPQDRIFCSGFGEFWPIDTNKTSKGKQRNRRVEIFLGTADSLSIGDAPTTASTAGTGEKVSK